MCSHRCPIDRRASIAPAPPAAAAGARSPAPRGPGARGAHAQLCACPCQPFLPPPHRRGRRGGGLAGAQRAWVARQGLAKTRRRWHAGAATGGCQTPLSFPLPRRVARTPGRAGVLAPSLPHACSRRPVPAFPNTTLLPAAPSAGREGHRRAPAGLCH
ncbi:MAG: hypothetical protein J3K34DRAFT_276470 [Monoraphidium minutum]|nr:MAG: hypothetical protein J3K34DRAFT_276470 [Monoraphidium minutum]